MGQRGGYHGRYEGRLKKADWVAGRGSRLRERIERDLACLVFQEKACDGS
jgi:hypothetical protein